MRRSISASSSSGSLNPSAPKILIPLSWYGLWLALITMPASARMLVVRCATAGVGIGPQRMTRPPIEQMPAASACSSMYPESRVSLPMRMRGTCFLPRPTRNVTARPSCSASSGVIGSTLAVPRMPSVPKRSRTGTEGFTGAATLAVAAPFVLEPFVLEVCFMSIAEVDELELDREARLPHELHRGLKIVLVLPRDANLELLDRGLHLQLAVFDALDDVFGVIGLDPFLHFDEHLRAALVRRLGLLLVEVLE